MAASVDITNEVTPVLANVTDAIRRAMLPAIGAAEVKLFQDNFLSLGTNKNNWPSTGFWAGAARSTNYDLLADAININVNQQGVRQRLEGGRINAKDGGWLTIPARQEAYGNRAREFNNLHFVFFRSNLAALAENQSQDVSFGRTKKDGTRTVTAGEERGGGVMFWLVRSVNQEANPKVIPTEQQIIETATKTATGIIERAAKRKEGGS